MYYMFRCMVVLDVTSSIDNDHFLQCIEYGKWYGSKLKINFIHQNHITLSLFHYNNIKNISIYM